MFRFFLKSALVMAVVTASTSVLADVDPRDPVGETANYVIDRNPQRTSSMIQSGTMKATVTAYLPDDPEGPAYEGTIDYSFRIQWVGNQNGTEIVKTPEEYFQPEFMEKLRTDGTYVGPKFKIRHLGFADARNLDGRFYPHCDKILIYDIQQDESDAGVVGMARALLAGAADADRGSIENLQIVGHIYAGVPVLGAVKLDVSGKYNGMDVKAGGDYQAQ